MVNILNFFGHCGWKSQKVVVNFIFLRHPSQVLQILMISFIWIMVHLQYFKEFLIYIFLYFTKFHSPSSTSISVRDCIIVKLNFLLHQNRPHFFPSIFFAFSEKTSRFKIESETRISFHFLAFFANWTFSEIKNKNCDDFDFISYQQIFILEKKVVFRNNFLTVF